MDILESLLVPKEGDTDPARGGFNGSPGTSNTMAAAVSSPLSSHEHTSQQPREHGPSGLDLANFLPPPSAQSPSGDAIIQSGLAGLSNLQDMADFERENPYIPPDRRLVPIQSNSNNASTVKFQELCQSRGLQPQFTFTEAFQNAYTVKVRFGLETVEITEPRLGKKGAKEAACALALPRLLEMKRSDSKRKSSEVGRSSTSDENWVGILYEYAQKHRQGMPEYQESCTTSTPFLFGCTVTIAGGPITPFGSTVEPFTSKREARSTAAKQAVLWLRQNGKLVESSTKRQKMENVTPAPTLSVGSTGLTQAMGDINTNTDPSASFAQRVNSLAIVLSLHQPRYDVQPSSTVSGMAIPGAAFYDVAAYFDERNLANCPLLAGAIGRVEHIHGKQKAKEACCEKVLGVLEEIRRNITLENIYG